MSVRMIFNVVCSSEIIKVVRVDRKQKFINCFMGDSNI